MAVKYKVGDKVRIKSRDWYNEHKDMNGNVCYGCEDIFNPCTARHCGQVLTITHINSLGWYEVEEEAVFVNDGMIEGLAKEDINIDVAVEETIKDISDKVVDTFMGGLMVGKSFNLPQGYQFKDENGNVINATKIVLEKKKKEYPKTYKECLTMTSYDKEERLLYLLDKFKQLLICRDAYWKIAGEEMGLGKPWEPDWNTSGPKYVIAYTSRGIEKQWETTYCKCFAFPTEEMRDEFKENFDRDLETCKELL